MEADGTFSRSAIRHPDSWLARKAGEQPAPVVGNAGRPDPAGCAQRWRPHWRLEGQQQGGGSDAGTVSGRQSSGGTGTEVATGVLFLGSLRSRHRAPAPVEIS